jgi:hypothetical protein
MKSRIYECRVLHARLLPKPHRFAYRIFMLALDLDELPSLHRHLRLFSVNRRNLYAFHEKDHLPTAEPLHAPSPNPICHLISDKWGSSGAPPGAAPRRDAASLKERVLAFLATRGVDLGAGGRVELVTLPRVFGYLFNPVSFYYCYDTGGACVAAIAEVTNTFREMKPYFLGPETIRPPASGSGSGAFHLRTPKHFYVSPFSDVDVAFDFNLPPPAGTLCVRIDDYQGEQRTLASTLAGPARPLTDARLAWFTFKYPLLTLRIIGLIHWHALLLYFKKIPWFGKAARSDGQRDLYRPHTSLTSPPAPDA